MCPSLLSFNGLVSPFIFAYSLLLEFRIFFAEFFRSVIFENLFTRFSLLNLVTFVTLFFASSMSMSS